MARKRADIDDVRSLFASMMQAASRSDDPRLFRAFDAVPREAFLPPGPWTIIVEQKEILTPTADPVHLYQNVLVEIDRAEGINNGEPFLHAAWIGAVAPRPEDRITHVGAGLGYYTAILAMLAPHGRVDAFEVNARLAAAARSNLEPFENVTVRHENAVTQAIPESDIVYVNAGVIAPPVAWLEALRPEGRMIFPWRPTSTIGIGGMITRRADGFAFEPLMSAWFIPCVGASKASGRTIAPDYAGAWRSRSVRLTASQKPDGTATAVYEDVWFSERAVA